MLISTSSGEPDLLGQARFGGKVSRTRLLLNLCLPSALFLAVTIIGIAAAGAEGARTAGPRIEYGNLVAILDSNRLRVSISGKIQTVRLLGTHAPSAESGQQPQCYSREALASLRRLLTSKTLALEADEISTGKEDQELLRYVYVQPGNRDLNAELIRNGWAVVQREIGFRRRSEFLELERGAQSLRLGLWAVCTTEEKITTTSILGQRKLNENASERLRELEQKTARQTAPPPSAVPPPRAGCCMTCRTGKACGNGCISLDKTCRQPPGCACDG